MIYSQSKVDHREPVCNTCYSLGHSGWVLGQTHWHCKLDPTFHLSLWESSGVPMGLTLSSLPCWPVNILRLPTQNITSIQFVSQVSTAKMYPRWTSSKVYIFISAHGCRGFSSWSAGSLVLRPAVRWHIMMWVGTHDGTEMLSSWELVPQSRDWDPSISYKGTTPSS